jgi:hypothetical protein
MEQYNFEEILNECVDRVLEGESIEQVLSAYPEHADELRPLLKTVASAGVVSDVKPRPEFKSIARAEFQSAARDLEDKKQSSGFFSRWYHSWKFGWSVASVSLLIVVMGLTGAVLVASDSMPDESLYSVKLATEKAHLAITTSDLAKAELNASYAERRIDEIVYMVEQQDTDGVILAANNLYSNLSNINSSIDDELASNVFADSNEPQDTGATEAESGGVLMFSAPEGSDETTTTTTAAAGEPAPSVSKDAERGDVGIASDQEADNSLTAGNEHLSGEYEELESKIRKYISRLALLERALENASEDVKPEIEQAIAQSQAEYEEALAKLELLKSIQQ